MSLWAIPSIVPCVSWDISTARNTAASGLLAAFYLCNRGTPSLLSLQYLDCDNRQFQHIWQMLAKAYVQELKLPNHLFVRVMQELLKAS